jgi:mevalonate kinase
MLSTTTIEDMVGTALAAGAMGGKVTGAGGGGCMIALAADAESQQRVAEALRGMGKDVYEVEIAG